MRLVGVEQTEMNRSPRRGWRIALAATLAATALVGGGVAQAPADAAPAGARIDWHGCYDGLYCGTMQVPLDWGNPGGAAISLGLLRVPATDPAHRIGSLFINPGGPGGSGVDFAHYGAGLFPAAVRARFDIIGFDPRGVGRSSPLRCFGTDNQAAGTFAPFPFPTTSSEEQVWANSDHELASACAQRGGAILDHMSTADVARDLDAMRQAVGDAGLTYYGVSYGTMLGQAYANLFPTHVRALVIDGVLDPIAWTTGRGDAATEPFSTRLHSAAGAAKTLNAFFSLCDAAGSAGCAFSGNSAARYAALAAALQRQPITFTNPDGSVTTFTYADLIGATLGTLYSAASWPDFAAFLAFLESQAPATGAAWQALRADLGYVTKTGVPHYVNFAESFPGVACADSDNPTSYQAWHDAAAQEFAAYGYFGPLWTWITSICQPWPGGHEDRYTGPWTQQTSAPVLVIGNLYDPATRYEGAVTASQLLPNSRLLTYEGWGHTALGQQPQCILDDVSAYLVDLTLPAAGTSCPATSPFTSRGPTARPNGSVAGGDLTPALAPPAVDRAFAN